MNDGDPVCFMLSLPMPTSVNMFYSPSFRKKPAYRAWISEAGWSVCAQRASSGVFRIASGWYCTHIQFPFSCSIDVDNGIKAVHDLLVNMQLTPDDKWLWGGSYARSYDVPDGMCDVLVCEHIEGSPAEPCRSDALISKG